MNIITVRREGVSQWKVLFFASDNALSYDQAKRSQYTLEGNTRQPSTRQISVHGVMLKYTVHRSCGSIRCPVFVLKCQLSRATCSHSFLLLPCYDPTHLILLGIVTHITNAPHITIWQCTLPYGTNNYHTGPYRTIWHCTAPPNTGLTLLTPSGTIWHHTVPGSTIWHQPGTIWQIRRRIGL